MNKANHYRKQVRRAISALMSANRRGDTASLRYWKSQLIQNTEKLHKAKREEKLIRSIV